MHFGPKVGCSSRRPCGSAKASECAFRRADSPGLTDGRNACVIRLQQGVKGFDRRSPAQHLARPPVQGRGHGDAVVCAEAKTVWAEAASQGITLLSLPGYNPDLMPVEALWRWLREDVTYYHCHATADDLTQRVAAFEVQVNQDPCGVADRLWVKNHLDPLRRNDSSRIRLGLEPETPTISHRSVCDLGSLQLGPSAGSPFHPMLLRSHKRRRQDGSPAP